MPAYPLPLIAIDFNAGIGRNRYAVGVMGVWQLEGLDLHDGLQGALNNAGNRMGDGWDEQGQRQA